MVSSNGSDTHSDLDISVVRTAIDMGHRMIDQIVNGVHNGSDEVRNLLYEQIDYILECKVCRNLFRSFPNLVAHKRIYCQVTIEEKLEMDKTVPVQYDEETVIVEPEAPEERSQTGPRTGRTGLLDRVAKNQFAGRSADYQFYTKIAENLELRKSAKVTNSVLMKAIPTNPHAVVVSHAKGDHSSQSTHRQSNGKSHLLNRSDLNSLVSDSSTYSKSVADICMKLASKQSGEVKKMDVTANTKAGESKRSRKSLPKKSEKEYVQFYPDTVTKKQKHFAKRENMQDMDVDDSWTFTLPQERTGQDSSNEWMKHCDIQANICKKCGNQCTSMSGLKNHLRHFHGLRVGDVKCPRCDKYYTNVKGVGRHLRNHHGYAEAKVKRYKMMVSKLKASERLIRHKGGVATDVKPLPNVYEIFPSTSVDKVPAKLKTSPEAKETPSRASVDKGPAMALPRKGTHLAKNSTPDWTKLCDISKKLCKMCGLKCESMSGLKNHLNKLHHCIIGEYKCLKCHNHFGTTGTLRRHLRRVHSLPDAQRQRYVMIAQRNASSASTKSPDGKNQTEGPASVNKGSIKSETDRDNNQDSEVEPEVEPVQGKEDKSCMVLLDDDLLSDKLTRLKQTVAKAQAPNTGMKYLVKNVPKESVRVSNKEPAKLLMKEAVKGVGKESVRHAEKETGKHVTKESAARTIAKEPAKTITRETVKAKSKEPASAMAHSIKEEVTTPIGNRRLPARSQKENVAMAAEKGSGVTHEPKAASHETHSGQVVKQEEIVSDKRSHKSQGKTDSSQVSKLNSREPKQSGSSNKANIPVRLSRPMKAYKSTMMSIRGFHGTGLRVKPKLPSKAVMGKKDIARFEREMKKLENSSGFVESNVYSSSGSGLKKQTLDE